MTHSTRLLEAARAVISAEDMPKPEGLTSSTYLRWEADKIEAKEAALKKLREALAESDDT